MTTTKFRAWDKQDKRFVVHEQDFIPLKVTNIGVLKLVPTSKEEKWILLDGERFIIEQWTGLIDIYDNDIVETSHHIYDGGLVRKNQVCFKDFCWRFVTLGIDRGSDIPIGLYSNYPESIKKIGNIYENPELLK